ncbi:MAG: glycosyltransferase [Schwartzia sp.]|nr:glycosyltransferase [Schwartzia sp. (in: firmicutes)]
MKISVCYIVKNEEENLPMSLETVRDIADELNVVDTGSSDATPRIAAEAGATVIPFTWRDDFAAARNVALDHATGDWIVFPDADEGFLHPEALRERLREIDALRPPVDAVMVTRVNLDGETEYGNDRAVRVFRRTPDIRYQGRIHENIVHRQGQFRLFQDDGPLEMYHTGYSGAIGRRKAERNLRLLLRDFDEYGENPGQYLYLADCYMGLGDYANSMKYAILALDAEVQPVASRVDLFHVAIESMRQLDWPLEEQLALAEMARDEYPEQPEFYGERGMILCALGRLEEARVSLERALALYEKPEASPTAETYFTAPVAAIVCARLGELEAIRGNAAAAEAYFRKALALDGKNAAIQAKYDKFRGEIR